MLMGSRAKNRLVACAAQSRMLADPNTFAAKKVGALLGCC
jgi:hypothetical protein